MLVATVLFSIMQAMVKYLGHLSHYQLIIARSVFSFAVCLFLIKRKGISPFGNDRTWLWLRGIFGVISLTCFFYAIHHMPLASVITIVNIKPFLILIVAWILIGEKTHPLRFIFFAISFCGIVLLKGFDERIEYISLIATIGAALFASLSHTIIRKLGKTEDSLVIIFYFPMVTIPIILPFMILNWVDPSLKDWIIMGAIAIVTHFAQVCLTKAYKYASVGNISNLYYLGIVFAFFIGYVFFDETYDEGGFIGLGLILAGIVLNLLFQKKSKEVQPS